MRRRARVVRELGAAALAAAAGLAAAVVVHRTGGAGARWAVALALAGGLAALQAALRARGPAPARGRAPAAAPPETLHHLDLRLTGARELAARPLELAHGLEELLAGAAGLSGVHIYVASHDRRHVIPIASSDGVVGGEAVALDQRASAWLVANRGPIQSARTAELPLGGLRQPIEALVASLGGDLVLPLVHRDELVGVVTARGNARRALRTSLGDVIGAQEAASSALAELRLRAAEAERAEVAREVERAARVQVESVAGAPVEQLAGWEVVRQFVPARQFSGAWWTTSALPGPRLLVALGEVTGRGVPAALLSASAVGVCQAAAHSSRGALEPQRVLELVHRSVRQAGSGAYRMSAFVAVLDAGAGRVSFAGAGHPFPYLWRPGGLGALVSRGSLLGGDEEPVPSAAEQAIGPGDAILFYSASATDARSAAGDPFGERRLRRLLQAARPGDELAARIAREVAAHMGDGTLEDDLLVATVAVRRPR